MNGHSRSTQSTPSAAPATSGFRRRKGKLRSVTWMRRASSRSSERFHGRTPERHAWRRHLGCRNILDMAHLFAMYVLSAKLGRPSVHPTYRLHSNSDRAYSGRDQTLRRQLQALRMRRRSNACALLALLASRRFRLRSRSRIVRTPPSQPGPRSSTVPPRFCASSPLRPRTGPAGLHVTCGHYHSTRVIFRKPHSRAVSAARRRQVSFPEARRSL